MTRVLISLRCTFANTHTYKLTQEWRLAESEHFYSCHITLDSLFHCIQHSAQTFGQSVGVRVCMWDDTCAAQGTHLIARTHRHLDGWL